jgi:hypothetical protein
LVVHGQVDGDSPGTLTAGFCGRTSQANSCLQHRGRRCSCAKPVPMLQRPGAYASRRPCFKCCPARNWPWVRRSRCQWRQIEFVVVQYTTTTWEFECRRRASPEAKANPDALDRGWGRVGHLVLFPESLAGCRLGTSSWRGPETDAFRPTANSPDAAVGIKSHQGVWPDGPFSGGGYP